MCSDIKVVINEPYFARYFLKKFVVVKRFPFPFFLTFEKIFKISK